MGKRRRKGGGRAARHAQRASKDTGKMPPIQPGLVGGQYKPLTDEEISRIQETALEVLEDIGMGTPIPELVESAEKQGAFMKDGRLCFPRGLMEDLIGMAARDITLYGRDPKHDLFLGKHHVYYGTGGAAISTLDFKSGEYRDSTLPDLYDFTRLSDMLDNVHWFTRTVVATELTDPAELDINTAYALIAGTKKHIGTSITLAEMVDPVIEMFDIVGGGKGSFAERPFCKLHTIPIIPPLRFGADASYTVIEALKHNWPINAVNAGQSGATAPAALAGTLVQTHAETLAALAMVNIWKPGHPFVFSNWPFVADLRTGAMTGGSVEGGLLNAAAAQLVAAMDLPSGVAGGMPDAKVPDMQAGYESGIPNVMIGLSGANLIYESSGMLASLLSCSFEAFVINNEIAGSCLRAVRGIDVTEESLSFEVIKEAVLGPGHYLGADQTIDVMETEYLYPSVGNRMTPMEWKEVGSPDVWSVAREKVKELMTHYPEYITAEQDALIRSKFDLKLTPDDISARSNRW